MSVHAVERVKQLMDCLVNQAVTPLVAACDEIEEIKRWLADESSRDQFQQELAFVVLRGLLGNESAVHYAGIIKTDEWERISSRALQELDVLLAGGRLPTLKFPADERTIRNVYAAFFVLEPYQYGEVTLREGDVFLDCGAYCGESALWAASKGAEKVFAFEPVPRSFSYLCVNAQQFEPGRIVPVDVGLGATSGRMSLSVDANKGADSIYLIPEEEGAYSVPVVTLDDWCRENEVKPDFIKMDLEGGEVDALKGAQGIIAEYKPRLAICLYHRLSDMWVIPRLVKNMVPKYRFWCRKIGPDFILYASL
ncbi:MAG: FkbM family methyltransferase [Azoarcus sp.]|nr:FkbM family methyltransferase [Azoarcus sp.]